MLSSPVQVRQLHSLSSHADNILLPSSLYHIPLSMPGDSPSHLSDHPPTPPRVAAPDSSSVDFRTFYPYTPNEVKHRKRTSRAQLKVLEDHFRRDTKPNAGLRKVLADQLGMSVRGVQVWFQNRRAKEKALAIKALSARKAKLLPKLGNHTPEQHGSPLSPGGLDLIPESPTESNRSASNPPEFVESASSESSPIATNPPPFPSDSCPTPWQNSPSAEDTVFIVRPGELEPFDSHLVNVRRGSLPVYPPSSDYPLSEDFDSVGRRRSVDNSLLRLASHPYAHLARAKNGALFGGRYSPPVQPRQTDPSFHPHPGRGIAYNPQIARSRLPHALVDPQQRASLDLPSGFGFSGSTSLTPFHAVRASLPGNHTHVMSSRTISAPLPGPLPSPNFSFGVAPSPPPQVPSPVDPGPDYTFRRRADDPDTEDDATSGSYDAYSRFGSMVSLAGSESSSTSAYYSDVGSCVTPADVRRGSSPNCGFLNLMSGLEVNGQTGLADSHASAVGLGVYSQQDGLPAAATPIASEMLRHDNGDEQSTSTYPSPSSTVSACQSPHTDVTSTAPCLPISRSSELAFALRDHQSVDSGNNEPPAGVSDPPPQHVPFFYVPNESDVMYAPIESAAGASGLPMMDFPSDKFSFEGDMISATGHYHPSIMSYASAVDGPYNADASFTEAKSRGQDALHGMEFAPPSNVYATYTSNTTVDPSSLESSHGHNNLHADSYTYT